MTNHYGVSGIAPNGTRYSMGDTRHKGPNGNYFGTQHKARYNPENGNYRLEAGGDVYNPSTGQANAGHLVLQGEKGEGGGIDIYKNGQDVFSQSWGNGGA